MRSVHKTPRTWLYANQWVRVKSSNVLMIRYQSMACRLHVKFKNGDTYTYHGVPPLVAQQMFLCASMGKFVWTHLRGRYLTEGPREPITWFTPYNRVWTARNVK